ncbi:MAG: hypothetical protein A2X00_10615 [Bacteroidetes bacterium GWE2_32_14]|nr:MAG: hypothetical protein A2X00_10615 [Bacteroidetes bacterium GWE2_32_14]
MIINKVVLLHLPFWTPLIPPLGISSIKSYLTRNGFDVKIYDANSNEEYKAIYSRYFSYIKKNVPEEDWGNFYSIGTDILRNHLMAHLFKKCDEDFMSLLKLLFKQIYNYNASDLFIKHLDNIIYSFYEWEEKYLYEILNDDEPSVIGISVKKDTLAASLFAFKKIKQINEKITTIMGGTIFSEQLPINSPDFNYFLERTKSYIDRYIIGHGEEVFLKLLKNEVSSDKQLIIQSEFKSLKTFSELNISPDFSDFNIDIYPYMGVSGSTGCYFNCTFCNVVTYFGKYCQKEVKVIVDELERLNQQYSSQLFFMCDNMVNTYITELSEEIYRRNLSVYWSAYMRVEKKAANIDEIVKWRCGGMYSARIGIDSASQRILDMMDKRISVEDSKIMLKNLASVGIKPTAYWLIGHPGETEEDFQMTLDYLTEMKDYIWEAECEYFNYYYAGQSNSKDWANQRILLYPEKYKEMIFIDKWIVGGEPSFEVIFSRVRRFVNHCKIIGLPNPYSLKEINMADERWKNLHSNAVPGVLDLLKKGKIINENINFQLPRNSENVRNNNEEFAF